MARARLALDIDDSQSDAQRLVAINDALDDAEFELGRHDRAPKVAGWLAVSGGAIAVLGALIAQAWQSAAMCALIAIAAIMTSTAAARRGKRIAGKKRERIDHEVAAKAGDLYDKAIVIPQRRAKTRRGRV